MLKGELTDCGRTTQGLPGSAVRTSGTLFRFMLVGLLE